MQFEIISKLNHEHFFCALRMLQDFQNKLDHAERVIIIGNGGIATELVLISYHLNIYCFFFRCGILIYILSLHKMMYFKIKRFC